MCENFLKMVDFSHEVVDIDDPLYLHEGRAQQKFSLEYDNAEVIPRMRGLQDFGLRTVQTKRKQSLSASCEKSVDNHVEHLSGFDYIIEGADQASTSRNAVSARRKRSYGGVIEEFIVKKRDRRQPFVHVLQSSVKLPPPCSFQPSCSVTGTLNAKETEKIVSTCQAKRSRCVYIPTDPGVHPDYGDRLEQSMLEETDMLADTADILLPGAKDYDPPELQVSGEFSSLIQEDVPLSAFMPRLNGQAIGASFDAGVSKWRMKGKRNIRNVGKRLIDAVDVKTCCPDLERSNGYINSTTHDVKESSLHFGQTKTSSQGVLKSGFYPIKEAFELESAYDESDLIERDLDQSQLTVYGNTRNQRSLHDSDEDSHGLAHNAFLGEPVNEADSQLVDVDLKVQLSYQGEHVPLVSLMSRFYGKAVIGHPIQIEILEDGSVNQLIVLAHDVVIDESTAPQAMWWTARRTTMHRVPRLIPSTAVLEKEDDVNLLPYPLHKKACYRYLNHQAKPAKKLQNKNVKRLSLSSRKTIKLSSLASNEKLAGESVGHELVGSNSILGGSVPLVTCVPVKVVFSRILKDLGRPSPAFHKI